MQICDSASRADALLGRCRAEPACDRHLDRGRGRPRQRLRPRDDATRAEPLLRRRTRDGDRHRSARVERARARVLSTLWVSKRSARWMFGADDNASSTSSLATVGTQRARLTLRRVADGSSFCGVSHAPSLGRPAAVGRARAARAAVGPQCRRWWLRRQTPCTARTAPSTPLRHSNAARLRSSRRDQ